MSCYNIQPNKTYANKANVVKAVEKNLPADTIKEVTWFIMKTEDDRYFPVFVGEKAVDHMVHFKFNVIM